MKILKYILLFLLVVIVGGLIYTATIPSSYDVSHSRVIKAPASAIYNTVNDLRTWEEWGPWYEADTTITVTYGDITSGVGANSSWTSKEGPGTMKTIAVEPNKSINLELAFEGFDPSDIYWTFEEVEGGTKVTWGMKADDAPFAFKIGAAMMGGWEGMFGPDQEKGLENIEKLMAKKMEEENSFRIGDVQTVDLKGNKFIGFLQQTSTDISHEEMTKLFMTNMPKAGIYAAQSGMQLGDYVPGSVFTKWDMENKEAEFYIGLLLNKKLKPGEGMTSIDIPKGKGVMVIKHGKYGIGDPEAHAKIDQYLKDNNLEPTGLVWELYLNDPTSVKPQDIQTGIYYALKN